MTKALAIAAVNVRRVMRDRIALLFIVVFPFAIILTIGAVFGASFTPVLGVVSTGSGPLGADPASRLEHTDGIPVRTFDDRGSLMTAVERGQVEAGSVIPAGCDHQIRAGQTVQLPYLARPASAGQEEQLIVAAVVDRQAVVLRAARFAASHASRPSTRGWRTLSPSRRESRSWWSGRQWPAGTRPAGSTTARRRSSSCSCS